MSAYLWHNVVSWLLAFAVMAAAFAIMAIALCSPLADVLGFSLAVGLASSSPL